MGHTIIEVMSMDKKFIAAVIVCVVALTAVATGTYFIGQKGNDVNLREAQNTATTANDNNIEVAQKVMEETTTEGDRVADDGEYKGSEPGETEVVGANNNVVEANTESNATDDEYMYGLSSEAAAQIKALEFNKNSQLLWPVQGNIIMPYDMESTVYYSTLDEYRCNPGLVIQSAQGTAIKAAADGVITTLSEDDELGVCINQAIGNGYIATYGQVINPEVAAGDFVEAGQTIAYVNKPTRYYTKEGDNIYFAIAKDGEPIDPLSFIDYED